jgi:hypothetical protein
MKVIIPTPLRSYTGRREVAAPARPAAEVVIVPALSGG